MMNISRNLLIGWILTFFASFHLSVAKAGESAIASPAAPTYVSPYYFGPNAFPIPDILVKTSDKLKFSLAVDYFHATEIVSTKNTTDIMLKAQVPLWTSRANLSLWWVVNEWYNDGKNHGTMSGDVYVSIDLQLLEERAKRPSWTLRAALKTASGGGYDLRRYYDSAGYFFDTYIGKTFKFGPVDLQLCGGGGFLCWQTDNGEQNDAIQFGALVGVKFGKFELSEAFNGYAGWQSKKYGKDARDCPMSFKTKLSYQIKQWEIFATMQNGVKDYPYNQFQIGTSFSLDILKRKKK